MKIILSSETQIYHTTNALSQPVATEKVELLRQDYYNYYNIKILLMN